MAGMKMTVAEHLRLGLILQAVHQTVQHELLVPLNTYPKGSKAARDCHRLGRAFVELRCEMDKVACRDHPEEFDVKWYYPGLG